MPLEVHIDGEHKGTLPDRPWPLPEGGWNEVSEGLSSICWNAPPGREPNYDAYLIALGPCSGRHTGTLEPDESVELTYGEVDDQAIGLFTRRTGQLPIQQHKVRLRRT